MNENKENNTVSSQSPVLPLDAQVGGKRGVGFPGIVVQGKTTQMEEIKRFLQSAERAGF